MNAEAKPDLIELDILATKSTPGLWKAVAVFSDEPTNAVVMCGQHRIASGVSLNNARLIAAMYNALPYMLKRINSTETFEEKCEEAQDRNDMDRENANLTADNEKLSAQVTKAFKDLKAITNDNPTIGKESLQALQSIIKDLEAMQ